jgi:RNA polymerase sigma factor (sigma-70 family)
MPLADSKVLCLNESEVFTVSDKALRRSGAVYGSWNFDIRNNNLNWSPEQYSIYGYSSNVKLNNDFLLIRTTHFTEFDHVTKIIENALAAESEYSVRRLIVRSDGRVGDAETQALIHRDEKGKAYKVSGITIDHGDRTDKKFTTKLYDHQYFDYIYRNYKKRIRYEIHSMVKDIYLADDLCQDVFLKAWKNIKKFNPERAQLFTWLVSIARNHCKDYFKSAAGKISANVLSCESAGLASHKAPVESSSLEIENLLTSLDENKKQVVRLVFLEGYTQDEAAKTLQLPLGTVKTRCRSAISDLRRLVEL